MPCPPDHPGELADQGYVPDHEKITDSYEVLETTPAVTTLNASLVAQCSWSESLADTGEIPAFGSYCGDWIVPSVGHVSFEQAWWDLVGDWAQPYATSDPYPIPVGGSFRVYDLAGGLDWHHTYAWRTEYETAEEILSEDRWGCGTWFGYAYWMEVRHARYTFTTTWYLSVDGGAEQPIGLTRAINTGVRGREGRTNVLSGAEFVDKEGERAYDTSLVDGLNLSVSFSEALRVNRGNFTRLTHTQDKEWEDPALRLGWHYRRARTGWYAGSPPGPYVESASPYVLASLTFDAGLTLPGAGILEARAEAVSLDGSAIQCYASGYAVAGLGYWRLLVPNAGAGGAGSTLPAPPAWPAWTLICAWAWEGVSGEPSILCDGLGRYHRALAQDDQIRYQRADFPGGAILVSATLPAAPTGTGDRRPCVTWHPGGRLVLLWERYTIATGAPFAVYEAHSTDGGRTWTEAALMFDSGSYPRIRTGPDGSVLRAARIGGALTVARQLPGQAAPEDPVAATQPGGAGIALADESFDLTAETGPLGRWLLLAQINGETALSDWFSTDHGLTWTRIASPP